MLRLTTIVVVALTLLVSYVQFNYPAPELNMPAGADAGAIQPCVAGFAAGRFPCHDVDLLAHVPSSVFSPTTTIGPCCVWGYQDLDDGREYAVLGLADRVAVLDVSDPLNPMVRGQVPLSYTLLHELRVYQVYNPGQARWNAYAYIAYDVVAIQAPGLSVIDLSDLPGAITLAGSFYAVTRTHTLQISHLDPLTGAQADPAFAPLLHLHVADGSLPARGVHFFSLADPVQPLSLGHWAESQVHDSVTTVVTGTRTSACAPGHDPCVVLFSFNTSNGLYAIDTTDPAQPVTLDHLAYPGLGYSHSGDLSADRLTLFAHDEQDESFFGHPTRVRAVDATDLATMRVSGYYTGPTRAIDHNGFTKGDRYYMTQYTRGLAVLDVRVPHAPVDLGYFDVYPENDETLFRGAFGVFPYLPSGTLLVSYYSGPDRGLFVLREPWFGPDTLRVAAHGQNAVHAYALTNRGHTADTYALSLSGNTWPVTLSATSLGPLAPGATAVVSATVAVPLIGAPADVFTLTGTSQAWPAQYDLARGETLAGGVQVFLPLVKR